MTTLTTEVWTPCLSYIEERVKRESFYTWLKPTVAIEAHDQVLLIAAPNKFVADWIKEHYSELINQALGFVTGQNCSHEMVVNPNVAVPPRATLAPPGTAVAGNGNGNGSHSPSAPCRGSGEPALSCPDFVSKTPALSERDGTEVLSPMPVVSFVNERQVVHARAAALLNPRYTFDSFVVGESNALAHAAAQAVSQKPGKTHFNPLCIYGTVGLGKTHLAQAIGNGLLETNPNARVLYASSEKFTNDFIFSLARGTTAEFSERYRSLDVLLIDDIQFFSGKESTQVQFFHTFNTLHQNGKQIVLTADRAPREIKGLEERLLSRFQWGLTVDIRSPDFETRVAILHKKLEGEKVSIPDDVVSYVARAANSNIRELEGALIRLIAVSSLEGAKITLETAQTVLRDTLSPNRSPITMAGIVSVVSQLFGVPAVQIVSKKRTQEVALSRQVAMYLARSLTSLSLKSIGAEFGGRDHSTVIHAVGVIRAAMQGDLNLKSQIDQAVALLYKGKTLPI